MISNTYLRISRFDQSLLLVLFGAALMLALPFAHAQTPGSQAAKLPFNTPMKYAMQLPPYCYSQYFGRPEPQFRLPPREICGVRTNHFCPGLANLYEARDVQDKGRKLRLYTRAADRFRDTLRNLQEYPGCPLRPEVESALMQAEMEMRRYQ